MYTRFLSRLLGSLAVVGMFASEAAAQQLAPPTLMKRPSIVYKLSSPNERLEMTVHTSRILTMEQKIPQAQVNNPEILDLTPLSPTQVQISAKTAGVTQVNLWGENKELYTVDVIVYGDVRELTLLLRSSFPNAALKVVPVANSVMISGFVDQPAYIDRIIRIAEEFYPKVINNMTVGGVQQVLLHVKVMEVSRTKLRQLGFDWAKITGANVVSSGPTGLISDFTDKAISMGGLPGADMVTGKPVWRSAGASTFAFNVVDGNNAFFGVLDALRQDNLMKIMSEPTLVTVSGRPASFNSGGEIPVPEPQSLGTISIAWKKYGTQIDFVPIVLGNGMIRLEVRPRVSELDTTQSLTIGGTTVPGIKLREADTGVELRAGQTLAIAGLVQTRVEAENAGLPWISELPYIGTAFRSVRETRNEVELLIMVTPELVEAMDACEVPPCGPGTRTTFPSDWELFMKGHLEVPNCCPADCTGCDQCLPGEDDSFGPPPGGMIGSIEAIPAPSPTSGNPQTHRNSSKANASKSRLPAESPNGPPGLIGPAGYDVLQ